MSLNRQFVKTIQSFYQQLRKQPLSAIQEQRTWLLRTFLIIRKQPDWVNAGFVLPTVAMVAIVVVLLTTAILFRSFERSKNASNVRVNEVVLKAATPAIDRAKVKIEQLFTDPTLPRSTPADSSLYDAFNKNLTKYTFGDEIPLAVTYDSNGGGIDETGDLEDRERIRTAWRFPVDTDNNGKFDSYTLYSIKFRSPSRGTDGKFDRARNPLDARTPPMDDGSLGGICSAAKGTSASLIGESGWYKSGANIKKSFFVYATTVPITTDQTDPKFEKNTGNKGFSALEFQQDQERTPISNNAVVYEDDLEITPGAGLRLNGRVFTNSNLLTAQTSDPIRFYQVSSPKSCFYQAQNSKIVVGGNVGNGRITGQGEGGQVVVDLFNPDLQPGANVSTTVINGTNKSASNTARQIAFNTQAFTQRINSLVNAQIGTTPTDYTKDPKLVQENIKARLKEDPSLEVEKVRREELNAYFKQRTRKVPFAEVAFGGNVGTATLQDAGTDKLRPQDPWIYPTNGDTKLTLTPAQLFATEPNMLKQERKEKETYLGDRILVGNNLPALWFDKTISDFVGTKALQKVEPATKWTEWNDPKYEFRTRSTKIEQLISLSDATERGKLFEEQATKTPKNPLDNAGGMRVVTGAGIYTDGSSTDPNASFPWDGTPPTSEWTPKIPVSSEPRSFLASFRPQWDTNFVDPTNTDNIRIRVNDLNFNSNPPIIVWPDSMPMTGSTSASGQKGDLLMRATAVYHYKIEAGKEQKPIACVSSYYDPTSSITAQNKSSLIGLTSWRNPDADQTTTTGKSNNGIVYPTYSGTRASALATYGKQLRQQARLVFPNGRFVNEPLREALQTSALGKPLSMAENSAIDTAVCAIQILNGTLTPSAAPSIPHGTIYETAFLDARQIKSIENTQNVANPIVPDFTRSIEQRQPLEVRVTVLDVNQMRQKTIGTGSPQEYLLPNSGIIYATRDDALVDLSDSPRDSSGKLKSIDERKLISPTDHKLDSTRRPNGIMLINGSRLDRQLNYRDEEKGLILATNLPAYVKGNFNLHAKGGNSSLPVEEFTEQLRDKDGKIDWGGFYNRKNLDDNFACRKNDPRLPNNKCTTGDSWRPATVLADAVTVLSDNFRFGFRDEGDYDLRNNEGDRIFPDYDFNGNGSKVDSIKESDLGVDLNGDGDTTDTFSEANQITVSMVRRHQGFLDNNYLTSSQWHNTTGSNQGYPRDDMDPTRPGNQGSSYVNNFVTPIQRRVNFAEYVMEYCPKIPVSNCQPNDWVVKTKTNTTPKASEIPVGEPLTPSATADVDYLLSGTTAKMATPELQRYARRVAFLRDPSNKLVLDTKGAPVPIGVDPDGKLKYYPYSSLSIPISSGVFDDKNGTSTPFPAYNSTTNRPRERDNALWFRTADGSTFSNTPPTSANDNYGKQRPLFYLNQLTANPAVSGASYRLGNVEQPILVPVLQIQIPAGNLGINPGNDVPNLPPDNQRGVARERNWVQVATETTTNLVIAGGDTPGRPTESNGGLENFVRYLEQWRPVGGTNQTDINHNISGSLIQYKRSAYATAPWQTIQSSGASSTSIFGTQYRQFYRTTTTPGGNTGEGMSPSYTPPARQWGFDVGLLSQLPDLFAEKFTLPPASKPNEFFREVGRDDEWVKTLLCAKTVDSSGKLENAIDDDDQRPTEFCTAKAGG